MRLGFVLWRNDVFVLWRKDVFVFYKGNLMTHNTAVFNLCVRKGGAHFLSHPVRLLKDYASKCVPLQVHGDGTPAMGIGKAWGKSIDAWSWSSCLVAAESQLSIFLIYCVHACLRCGECVLSWEPEYSLPYERTMCLSYGGSWLVCLMRGIAVYVLWWGFCVFVFFMGLIALSEVCGSWACYLGCGFQEDGVELQCIVWGQMA